MFIGSRSLLKGMRRGSVPLTNSLEKSPVIWLCSCPELARPRALMYINEHLRITSFLRLGRTCNPIKVHFRVNR